MAPTNASTCSSGESLSSSSKYWSILSCFLSKTPINQNFFVELDYTNYYVIQKEQIRQVVMVSGITNKSDNTQQVEAPDSNVTTLVQMSGVHFNMISFGTSLHVCSHYLWLQLACVCVCLLQQLEQIVDNQIKDLQFLETALHSVVQIAFYIFHCKRNSQKVQLLSVFIFTINSTTTHMVLQLFFTLEVFNKIKCSSSLYALFSFTSLSQTLLWYQRWEFMNFIFNHG